jgi:hypothetical protein
MIEGAMVSVEAKGVPPSVYTDNRGVFRLDLSGSPESVRVRVDAAGYEPFNQFVPLTQDRFEDIRLKRSVQAPSPTPSIQPAVPSGSPHASPRRTPTRKQPGADNANLLRQRQEGINAVNNDNHP